MEDLTIKKDGKTIFDSQGKTLENHSSSDIFSNIGDHVLSKGDYQITISIRTIQPTPTAQGSLGLPANKLTL
jgi:hypothetical protein